VRRVLPLLSILLAVAACGTDEQQASTAPQTLPAAALPELDSRARSLDEQALAADALTPRALADLLTDAGYVTGTEREFSGKTRTFDRVVARTLVFESEEGAERYLDWLRSHGRDLLGRAVAAQLELPEQSGVALTLVRCGSCKKELPTFLGGWRRGTTVLSLLAAGSGANAERFSELARDHDDAAT
jgi:hypothetical protein